MQLDKHIGERVRAVRRAKDWSADRLSKQACLGTPMFRAIEAGRARGGSIRLSALSRASGVSVHAFYNGLKPWAQADPCKGDDMDLVIDWLMSRAPELIAALVSAGTGAVGTAAWKGIFLKRRIRQRIGSEILDIQGQLYARANPSEGWRTSGIRETWMLQPFTAHIKLLIALTDQEQLSPRIRTALGDYEAKAEAFVVAWARAKARHRKNFWGPYDDTLKSGEEVLRRLGQERVHRPDWANLAGKQQPEDQDPEAIQPA